MNETEKPRAAATRRGDATRPPDPPARCASEACPRPVEQGETYCAECGLERSLFFRERRDGKAELRENLARLFWAR